MEPKVYSELEMEAALCIWENMLEARAGVLHSGISGEPLADWIVQLDKAFEDVGTIELRYNCRAWAREMLKAHDALRDGCADLGFDFRERFWLSYDWDFTPAWLESGIDWETLSALPVLDATKAMLEKAFAKEIPAKTA